MPEFRLYIDETGDHTRCVEEKSPIGSRYLGLVGVMLERQEGYDAFAKALEDLKRKHLPYDADEAPPILHRKEIINLSGPFYRLQDPARRASFDSDLLTLLKQTPFQVIAVVVDKLSHGRANYRLLQHSYHYCLLAMLERYCGLLKIRGNTGDVMVESRGASEDHDFEAAYAELWEHGSGGKGFLSQALTRATLTSRKPKMKKKSQNIAGLQLADLIAHTATRDVLRNEGTLSVPSGSPFAEGLAKVLAGKYNRQLWTGRIAGYGRVLLR